MGETAMNDILIWLLACLAGIALGLFFFGGLWWTVRRSASSRHPARLFVSSFLVRMMAAVGGFYLIAADGDWRRVIASLLGFLIARWLVLRWTRPGSAAESPATQPGQGG
jgi:F1F0 ATPase subunit 2